MMPTRGIAASVIVPEPPSIIVFSSSVILPRTSRAAFSASSSVSIAFAPVAAETASAAIAIFSVLLFMVLELYHFRRRSVRSVISESLKKRIGKPAHCPEPGET